MIDTLPIMSPETVTKVTTPKCDTCFSLVTWEGVVQKIYRQGD
jgi:hypothetical protein